MRLTMSVAHVNDSGSVMATDHKHIEELQSVEHAYDELDRLLRANGFIVETTLGEYRDLQTQEILPGQLSIEIKGVL